jgi:tRNA(fMet)-specific endonuclease VapC
MKGETNTTQKLKSLSPSIIYTSTITQMEITYGLLRKFDLSHRYFAFLKEFFSVITILSFNESAADQVAIIKKTLEAKGTTIGAYDILIASIAVSENLTLVSSNEKEFLRVDNLVVENWRN